MRNQCGLDRMHVPPRYRAGTELRSKLVEIAESLLAADQVGIGNRVGGTREEIGQPHLVAYRRRQHVEGQIKRPGNLLEDTVEQFVSCGVDSRGATFLSNFQHTFHALFPMTRKEQELLVAIEGIETGLPHGKLHRDRPARGHISFNR